MKKLIKNFNNYILNIFYFYYSFILFCYGTENIQSTVLANENAKRLFDDLMMSYNRHRRPSALPNEAINVHLRLRLSQIIDVHELDQIMTISVWLKQEWIDQKLRWKPSEYGGVSVLYVPYEMIWVPDIVLINNAEGFYNITINTKATLHSDGRVVWEPPAIFKSLCQIDIQWFPFDEQNCHLKFSSWSFPTNLLHLTLTNESSINVKVINSYGEEEIETIIEDGIDLSDYYPSVEWDIMGIQAKKRLKRFMGSKNGDYEEIDIEIIPANSTTLPFVGKYLLFTMILVTLSVLITVVSLQFHFRKPTTHQMSSTVRKVFLNLLPRFLMMRRPVFMRRFPQENRYSSSSSSQLFANFERDFPQTGQRGIPLLRSTGQLGTSNTTPLAAKLSRIYNSPKALQSFENLCFIAELLKKKDRETKVG
ncbi:hypothetical protein Mgra_00002433 [Meloidogyne graminicola]|uniref:Neurotransmitter-gated ion-channel ligand-binding domain-containing protein n=1 Tax=Meloidogyne graminicola TaxID=189291 RepID=A0A8S9ZWT8_9BILA|nr:hypothetical protein Mgra_00002433 [Meloidogyne graminicola]